MDRLLAEAERGAGAAGLKLRTKRIALVLAVIVLLTLPTAVRRGWRNTSTPASTPMWWPLMHRPMTWTLC